MLIHSITPELPPRMGGVANHVERLAAHWPDGSLSSWWVASGAEEAARANPRWTVRPVPVDASGDNWPESGTVFVHYTQYGYAGGGIPWRLVVGLRRWRRGAPEDGGEGAEDSGRKSEDGRAETGNLKPEAQQCSEPQVSSLRSHPSSARSPCTVQRERRLVVFFHETWLEGPLWRRRGLAAPFARWCARTLARSADVVVTNCEKHAAQLADLCDVAVLPIPASIEPSGGAAKPEAKSLELRATSKELEASSLELGAQKSEANGSKLTAHSSDSSQLIANSSRLRLVIFGLPETRLRALRGHRAFLAWLSARGELGELVLLGAGDEADRFAIAGIRLAKELAGSAVRRVGATDAAGVSAELVQADLGLSAYAADEVGKSGTLAALFTHGCAAGCAGHDAGGLAFDLSLGVDGAPRDWLEWQDAGARAKREVRVAAYVADSLDWRAHAERLAGLVRKT